MYISACFFFCNLCPLSVSFSLPNHKKCLLSYYFGVLFCKPVIKFVPFTLLPKNHIIMQTKLHTYLLHLQSNLVRIRSKMQFNTCWNQTKAMVFAFSAMALVGFQKYNNMYQVTQSLLFNLGAL